jgi:cytochrome c oxidase subunit 4
MQALRLARPRAPPRQYLIARGLATTANPSLAASSTSSASSAATTIKSQQSIIPLSNVEAQWEKLSKEDQVTVHSQLEALQKKDWKTLSIDEKKAGGFRFFAFLFLFY